jgi:hypothetical protein
MKRLVCLMLILGLMASSLLAQAESPKAGYPFELQGTRGVAKFAGKTYDEAWVAVLKSLIASNFKTELTEKDAGIIEATKTLIPLKGTTLRRTTSLGVLVEAKDGGVVVTLKWDMVQRTVLQDLTPQRKKIYGEFFQKVADLLYPAEAIR